MNRPRLLLLDEPLSALDANLRRQMQIELKSLQREVGITFIFVTHNQEEAMVMSDRIALLRSGKLEQIAPPREIYTRPTTSYAAQFIGRTNLLRGEVRGGIAVCGAIRFPAPLPEEPALFSLRPENIRIGTPALFTARLLDRVSTGPPNCCGLSVPTARCSPCQPHSATTLAICHSSSPRPTPFRSAKPQPLRPPIRGGPENPICKDLCSPLTLAHRRTDNGCTI